MMTTKKAEKISKALSSQHRLKVVNQVKRNGNELACSLAEDVTGTSQPPIYRHLKLLTDAEVIISRNEGKHVKYQINDSLLEEYILFIQELKTD